MKHRIALSQFTSIRPPYETEQKETLDWLVAAHTAAHSHNTSSRLELEQFQELIRARLWHVGCKPDGVRKRGHILADYLHRDWESMQIYRLEESPHGSSLGHRTKLFESYADQVFEQFYPSCEEIPPENLIHVTCTGYVSPSGAQKIVSFHGWGDHTKVTHAYHMGCYGSIPALRIAMGFLAAEGGRTDVVHTEMCSLHVNPSLHGSDQLVTQSLFADGFIKYSLDFEPPSPHFTIQAIHEEIIPGSIGAMVWKVSNWGFEMSLAKEIPSLIARAIDQYLMHLCKKANCFPEKIMTEALFAVHPGGPKILQYVKKHLQLKEHQMEHSQYVLREYGNMSSATLPHIWKEILEDDRVPFETPIITLAFGPGLTICGAVLKKCGGSP